MLSAGLVDELHLLVHPIGSAPPPTRSPRARAGQRAWSRGCVAAAVALLVTAGCLMTPFGTVLLYAVLTSTWIFTAFLLKHLRDTRHS